MLAELHCHSTYSTGKKILLEGLDTPEAMVRHAKKIGLNIISVTDHDTLKGSEEAKKFAKRYGIIVIPGEEVSTRKGHILAIGIQEEVPQKLSVSQTLDLIRSQGGIAIASHPFDVKSAGLEKLSKNCDALEVFNAINIERISNWKAMKFAKKYSLPMTAGSDAHCKEMLGYGVTDINSDDDIDNILDAIRKGKTSLRTQYMTTDMIMEWGVKRLKHSYSFTLNYINRNYRWPKRAVYRQLLGLVNHSPGNIDYVFKMISYFSFGSVLLYRAIREVLML